MKRKEELMPVQEPQKEDSNLTNLERTIELHIQDALKLNHKSVGIIFPENPKEDAFLMSENRKSFKIHFDIAIMEKLKEAGYKSKLSETRHRTSGILHYLVEIDL